jgi:hypothetical protein
VPQSVTTRSSSILDVDFGAGTLMTSNPLDLFQFNGTINGTTFSGAVRNNANTDTATPGSIDYLEAGTGTFSGGFYGTDQIAGTWQTTGNVNGNQMGGIFFGEQR